MLAAVIGIRDTESVAVIRAGAEDPADFRVGEAKRRRMAAASQPHGARQQSPPVLSAVAGYVRLSIVEQNHTVVQVSEETLRAATIAQGRQYWCPVLAGIIGPEQNDRRSVGGFRA